MRCNHLAVVCVAALGLSGCSGPSQPAFGRAAAETIRTVAQSFAAAYNQKDPDELASFFSGSGVLMPPNSSLVRGSDSIKGFYDIRFSQGVGALEIEPTDVGGHGTLAYVSGSYSLQIESEDGPDGRDRGKFLWILRNYAGQWRFDYQMWSSDLPPLPAEPSEAS